MPAVSPWRQAAVDTGSLLSLEHPTLGPWMLHFTITEFPLQLRIFFLLLEECTRSNLVLRSTRQRTLTINKGHSGGVALGEGGSEHPSRPHFSPQTLLPLWPTRPLMGGGAAVPSGVASPLPPPSAPPPPTPSLSFPAALFNFVATSLKVLLNPVWTLLRNR